jgi:DNA mismatch repair protein MutH
MQHLKRNTPPTSEKELLALCSQLEGLTFNALANVLDISIPQFANRRKGFVGQLIELALGANAGNLSAPDFQALQIELKTLPIGAQSKPRESTYVTSIPLLTIHQQQWKTSQCFAKLKRVLWVPVEGDIQIPYEHRRIGQAFIWSPSRAQEAILECDWQHFISEISIGNLELLDSSVGDYLQIRPKAADGKVLCDYFNSEGNKVKTLPRGFYLRSSFTAKIFAEHFGIGGR